MQGANVSGEKAKVVLFYFMHLYFITVSGGYLLVLAKNVQVEWRALPLVLTAYCSIPVF